MKKIKESIFAVTRLFILNSYYSYLSQLKEKVTNIKNNIVTITIGIVLVISFFITSLICLSVLLLMGLIKLHLTVTLALVIILLLNVLGIISAGLITKSKVAATLE